MKGGIKSFFHKPFEFVKDASDVTSFHFLNLILNVLGADQHMHGCLHAFIRATIITCCRSLGPQILFQHFQLICRVVPVEEVMRCAGNVDAILTF